MVSLDGSLTGLAFGEDEGVCLSALGVVDDGDLPPVLDGSGVGVEVPVSAAVEIEVGVGAYLESMVNRSRMHWSISLLSV